MSQTLPIWNYTHHVAESKSVIRDVGVVPAVPEASIGIHAFKVQSGVQKFLPKKQKRLLPLERRLRRGGERVRFSFSSLAAGGATWFAPG